MNYGELEDKIGYVFKDKELLVTALTLSSAEKKRSNQTLEFLGDAVLELIVTEKIFDIDKTEGELTYLRTMYVSDDTLKKFSENLGLEQYFIKGKGDVKYKKAVPSAYEAVLGAVYLDGGLQSARAFVERTMDFSSVQVQDNSKNVLQRILQAEGKQLPDYKNNVKNVGTVEDPVWEVTITVEGKNFSGRGERKDEAGRIAAEKAVEYLNELGGDGGEEGGLC